MRRDPFLLRNVGLGGGMTFGMSWKVLEASLYGRRENKVQNLNEYSSLPYWLRRAAL